MPDDPLSDPTAEVLPREAVVIPACRLVTRCRSGMFPFVIA